MQMPFVVLGIMALVAVFFYNYPFFIGTIVGGLIWAYPAIRRRRFKNEYGPQPYETPEKLPEFFHIRTKDLSRVGMILCLGTFLFQLPKIVNDVDGNLKKAEQEKTAEAEEVQKQKAASVAKDEEEARSMGLSYDDYIKAEHNAGSAHESCQNAVMGSASWSGANRYWTPKYSWSISGDIITISGHDITMKNGFGGEKEISYRCAYNVSTRQAIPLSVD